MPRRVSGGPSSSANHCPACGDLPGHDLEVRSVPDSTNFISVSCNDSPPGVTSSVLEAQEESVLRHRKRGVPCVVSYLHCVLPPQRSSLRQSLRALIQQATSRSTSRFRSLDSRFSCPVPGTPLPSLKARCTTCSI